MTLDETARLKLEFIDAYLERVGFQGSATISLHTLCSLHSGHVLNIPFENLDIHLGKAISLEPGAMFDKLVTRRRGGYCYEMNGLLAMVLSALGFEMTRLQGRIIFGYDEVRPRSHQLLLVRLDGQDWLCDVGYGGRGLIEPIPLEIGVVSRQYNDTFRLIQDPFYGYILQTIIDGEWADLVGFTLEPQHPIDYLFPNYWNSTSPDSRFVQHRIAAKPTPEGRLSLFDNELKIRRHDETITHAIHDEAEFRRVLVDYFGLVIEGDFVTQSTFK